MKPKIDKFEKLQVWEYDDNYILIGARELNINNRSPISGNWQIPAKCTTIQPPEEKEGFLIFFNSKTKTWDYRRISDIESPTEKYYTDQEPLDHVQRNRIVSFKNNRFVDESNPIIYNDHEYDFDERSRERLLMAYLALDQIDSITWSDTKGIQSTLTKSDISKIFLVGLKRSDKLYEIYKEMKQKVMDCKTTEEVRNLEWPKNLNA